MKPGLAARIGCRPGLLACAVLLILTACGPTAQPPKQYVLRGQILAILPERQSLTISHEDIPNFMPAMTMTYTVADPGLMSGRTVGETIVATLEVGESTSRLTSIAHTGSAPVPESANAIAMATGVLAEGDVIPDAALVDQSDQRFSVSGWKGKTTLLTFTYTTCPLPDYCPLVDEHFMSLQDSLAKDQRLAGRVRLVSLSFDPTHDTPAVLAAHALKRHADPALWTFATGDERTVDRFAGKFGVTVVREADGTITHALRTFLIDRDGRIRKIYSGSDWKVDHVLADLRETTAEP
jgi:protein SCO1/2